MAIGVPGLSEIESPWFDDLVRVPDHIAGAVAAWDIDNNRLAASPKKYSDVLRQMFADNPNFALVRLKIGDRGLQASRVMISQRPLGAPSA